MLIILIKNQGMKILIFLLTQHCVHTHYVILIITCCVYHIFWRIPLLNGLFPFIMLTFTDSLQACAMNGVSILMGGGAYVVQACHYNI